ncbi:MAG: hypothetical protein WCF67_05655 [Chitinophagaceae bacterium]
MAFNLKYVPALRGRQQELIVLSDFDFGERIYPLLEIIKEKDRVNNAKPSAEIWTDYIHKVSAPHVLVDLPVYIRDSPSMQDEVILFNRTMLSNLERRIDFFKSLASALPKIIPVVSTLALKTGEAGTISKQISALRQTFPIIAIRTFTNTLEIDLPELNQELTAADILIYDLDTTQPYSPLVRKQARDIAGIVNGYKVVLRSAINTEIQNTKLDHGDIVPDADNSLLEAFRIAPLKMNAFGDYGGIKKDELSSGGTISPGFIFYDPIDNLYYGYRGNIKDLSEFELTIIPAVLGSPVFKSMQSHHPEYVDPTTNTGIRMLREIAAGTTPGKSQAKFKRISMEHYLHCMKVLIEKGTFD